MKIFTIVALIFTIFLLPSSLTQQQLILDVTLLAVLAVALIFELWN